MKTFYEIKENGRVTKMYGEDEERLAIDMYRKSRSYAPENRPNLFRRQTDELGMLKWIHGYEERRRVWVEEGEFVDGNFLHRKAKK